MATFKDIAEEVNRQLEQSFDNVLFVDWINECLSDLTQEVYLPTKTVLTANVNGEFDLPANYKGDLSVRAYGEKPFLQQVAYDEQTLAGYTYYGGVIAIVNRGPVAQIEILYSRRPSPITNSPTAVPDIPEQFHYIISAFCRMKAMLFVEDIGADERYRIYEKEYSKGKNQFLSFFADQKTQTNRSMQWQVIR